MISLKQLRSAVQQAGALVPDHLPWGEDHPVAEALVVQDEERPVPPDCLADVEDGRDDVRVEPVHMGGQPGSVGVAPFNKIYSLNNTNPLLIMSTTRGCAI